MTTIQTPAIIRPPCPKCRTRMMLARIEPVKLSRDRYTFECPRCNNSESVIMQFD